MTLRTKILLTGGFFRFGGSGLLLALSQLHWFGVVIALGWMLWCRPALRCVLLPTVFPSTRCPRCRYLIVLRQFWGCGEHYKDHKVRHVLGFHCNEGHDIKIFECPRKECRATVQVQKGIDSKARKGVILGNAFAYAPGENRPGFLCRLCRLLRYRRYEWDGLKLNLGYDRRAIQGRLVRWIRRMCGRDTHTKIMVPETVYGRHITIFGKSGMGKSKLILSMAQWIFENGMGATFVDKAGDLARDIVRIVPEHRKDDVLLIRIADRKCPFQFNILQAHDEDEAIDMNEELLHALQRISQSWGENIAYEIEIGVETAKTVDGSLKTVYDLFADSLARDRILPKIDNPELLEFWEKYERRTASSTSAVKRKLGRLIKHPRLGPMLSARKSNFDADAIIRESKIVVIDLSTGSASQEVNIVLGTFLIGKIRAAAFRQQFTKESERVRHWLVIDEAKNFMHRGMDLEKIFSEARKFKLSLVLANQNVGQMNEEVKNEAFGNAGVLVTFNVDHSDAKLFADRMPNVTVHDITTQGVGECIAKIHNDTHFIKTELPTIPEYDPTAYIEAKMEKLNRQEPEEEDGLDDVGEVHSAAKQSPYLVDVIEGVR